MQDLYPGVLSDEMRDLILRYTMMSGDLRVGISLIQQSVRNAEFVARCEVTKEDIDAAYETARYVHLSACVRALSPREREILMHIAATSTEDSPFITTGAVYGMVKESIGVGYTVYFEHLKKLDEMRLITLTQGKVRGNTREIALRYDAGRVVEACEGGK